MAGLFCFLRRDFKIYFFLLQSNCGPLVLRGKLQPRRA